MQTAQSLVRKQYLVTEKNVKKLERIAKTKGTSATEIVRQAIDAYDPENFNSVGESELMELVSARLKETIADTQATRKRLRKTLSKLEAK
ncbi:MAG TPA: hypothetical protein EYH06_14115 [Chromatiales bacterium]|nr:hypothetical protein [Thiotrichales bacterium]HIP69701.1 hypothetical protein [Chromatiales bacterium]